MRHAARIAVLLLLAAAAAHAQELVFQLEPQQSKVEFTVDATMHTVHGTMRLKPASIKFDPTTGAASGTFVADATTAETGDSGRDKKMHQQVLESAKYPEIAFVVTRFHGTLPPSGTAQLQLTGTLTLHGADHPFVATAPVQFASGRATADAAFDVPYVEWGLKDPSVFLLRVAKTVHVAVHAVGTVGPRP